MNACVATESQMKIFEAESHAVIIAAAVAAILGGAAKIRSIREVDAAEECHEWVRLGRTQMDGSHNLRELYRSMPDREPPR